MGGHKYAGTNLLEYIGYGFCNILDGLADKLYGIASNMEIDASVLETIPLKYAEKMREAIPTKGIFSAFSSNNVELSEAQITVDPVLDGFDDEYLRKVKSRIINACKFIMSNVESDVERKLAIQLATMFQKRAIIITDTYLMGNEQFAAYFQPKKIPEKGSFTSLPYIGLDITTLIKNDDATIVNILVHETYHAWRFYTSNTEYSVIDETRAWNVALQFSNKFRVMHGIPVEREKDYTLEEISRMGSEYKNAVNVNIRFGPGTNIIEKIAYGIANKIEDAADSIDGWTNKIMEKSI